MSSHLAVRSGLGSVVVAVLKQWRDSWRKAGWSSCCRRCWSLHEPVTEWTPTSVSHLDRVDGIHVYVTAVNFLVVSGAYGLKFFVVNLLKFTAMFVDPNCFHVFNYIYF